MKTKKLAALLSAAAMAVTSLSITAFAAADATVGNFADLKAAVTGGKKNIEVSQTIKITENIDLTDVTLKASALCTGNGKSMLVVDGATVKITGGTIDGNMKDHYVINVNSGSLTLDGTIVSNDPGNNYATNPPVTAHSIVRNNGTLIVDGAEVTSKNGAAAVKSEETSTKLTITGASKISGKEIGITTFGTTVVEGDSEVSTESGTNALYVLTYGGVASKTTVNDATITGTIVYGSDGTVVPEIEIGENAVLKNSGVTKTTNAGYNTLPQEGGKDKLPTLTIDPAADVTLAAGADKTDPVLVAALEEAGLVIGDDGKLSEPKDPLEGLNKNEIFTSKDGVAIDWGADPAVAVEITELPNVEYSENDVIVITYTPAAGKSAKFKLATDPDYKVLNGDGGETSAASPFKYVLKAADTAKMTGITKLHVQGENATVTKVEIYTKNKVAAEKPETAKFGDMGVAKTELNNYKNAVEVKADKIPALTKGNAIVIDFEAQSDAAIKVVANTDAGWKTPFYDKAVTKSPLVIELTEEQAKMLNGNGLSIQGKNATVTKVQILAKAPETKPDDNNNNGNNAGYVVITPNDTTAATDTSSAETTADTAAATTANGSASEGDKNQATGVVLAVIPAMLAAAGVVASKKRK